MSPGARYLACQLSLWLALALAPPLEAGQLAAVRNTTGAPQDGAPTCNHSTSHQASPQAFQDSNPQARAEDWEPKFVERDLMDYIVDLKARYKDKIDAPAEQQKQATLSGRVEEPSSRAPPTSGPQEAPKNESAQVSGGPITATKQPHPTNVPVLSTSLATGLDQEVSESFWQYGIFDRFTRAKSTTHRPASTASSSQDYADFNEAMTRNFNSDECGLRRYNEERQDEELSSPEQEINEGLKQRRQRLPLSPLDRKKLESVLALINSEGQNRGEDRTTEWPVDSFESKPQPSDNTNDSEFNLAARRLWLQQQLDSTLSMLGFSMSNQTANDFLNDTIGLNLNFRERVNAADLTKMAKVLSEPAATGGASETSSEARRKSGDHQMSARQDDAKLEARVIGGTDARLGDSPWSVSLQALVSRPGTGAVEYRHYCGGTIISEHYVLTAAHCLDFMVGREARLFVVIGDLSWRMSAASMYGRRFGVEKLIIHSGYKSTAFGHDIGLIRTKESMKPLKVNGKYIINSVCLPHKGVEHSGEAELVGWGLFSNRNEMADSLQIADVPILPRPLCVDLYRRRTGLIQWLIGIELITDKQVCAGTFGRGICQGDSGSALVVNERSQRDTRRLAAGKLLRQSLASDRDTKQSRATIIGVVAFGGIRRCSYQSLPGVYMQTSKYLDWIVPRIQS